MNLEFVMKEWKEDCKIDTNDLFETSRSIPALHAKYLELLATAKLRKKSAEFAQKTLLKKKWLYYNGKMNQDDIEKEGWEPDPFDGLKILKGEMDYYYDSDPEIQESEQKIEYLKTCIDTLTEIVENVKWRHQTISNMIKWRQFESGG
jgi:hypothetical protein